MNKISLKNYEFEDYLLENVQLFDEIFVELGESPLLENENFAPFLDFEIFSHYLVLECVSKKQNTIPIIIWFEGSDLVIDIDGNRESLEWSKKQIQEDRNSVLEFIRNLFTGYILVDYKGSSRFIQIFDSAGNLFHCFSYNNLFHMVTGRYLLNQKGYRNLYFPLFDKI